MAWELRDTSICKEWRSFMQMHVSKFEINTLEFHIRGYDFNCDCEAWLGIEKVFLSKDNGSYTYKIISEINIDAFNESSVYFKAELLYKIVANGAKPLKIDLMAMANTATIQMGLRLDEILKMMTNYKTNRIFSVNQKQLELVIDQILSQD